MNIEEKLQKIKELHKIFNEEVMNMFHADEWNIFPLDMFAIWIVKRSILLNAWFIQLIESKNFLAAASLIRLHLDSLLQLYAAFIVESPHDFAVFKMKWKETRDYRDKKWKKLTDSFLKRKFFEDQNNERYQNLKEVYWETSWFVHFSDKHIFWSMNNLSKNIFETEFSKTLEVDSETTEEALLCMYTISQWILFYLKSWIHTKDSVVR